MLHTAACDKDELTAAYPLWSADRASKDNPLPDDRLDAAQGGLILRPQALLPFTPEIVHTPELVAFFDRYAAHAGAIDGWGNFASAYVRFSAPIDTPLEDDAVAIVDLEKAEKQPIQAIWHADPGFLEIAPKQPLAEGGRYALVITDRVTAHGTPLQRSRDFAEKAEDDPIVAKASAALEIQEDEIVLASPFHTQASTAETLRIADWIQTLEPTANFSEDRSDPEKPRGVFTRQNYRAAYPDQSIDLDAAGRIAVGTFSAYEFRNEGVIDAARIDDPAARTELEVVLVEPRADRFPPPWPVVIVQHGFNGSKSFVLERSGEYTRVGFAVIGIDAAGHGSRGIALQFINLDDVRKLRDAFRETALDLLQLDRLAKTRSIDIDGLPGADFDGNVLYFGHSMGAIVGAVFVGIAPQDRIALLNASGGAFREIFAAESLAAGVAILLRGAIGLSLDDPGYQDVRPVIYNLAQVIFEQADPIVYAPRTKIARVLLQEGIGDRLVPACATELLAAAADLPERREPLEDPRGLRAWWRVDPAAFGVSPQEDPHGVYFLIPEVRDQAVEYLRSRGTRLLAPVRDR